MTREDERHVHTLESVHNFLEWCRVNGIKRFLIDGDSTLWEMESIFNKYRGQCCEYLGERTQIHPGVWRERLVSLDNQVFETHSVNPLRWEVIMADLAKQFFLSYEVREKALVILMKIYEEIPGFLPGSQEWLGFLNLTQIPKSLVTHANENWTWKKFGWLGLSRYFLPEEVHIINEDGYKTVDSWLKVINHYGLRPEECAVIGDSPLTDINPTKQAGVKHAFLLKTDVPIWSIHNQPVDTDVMVISSLEQLMELKP